MKYGLSEDLINKLTQVIRNHDEVQEVVIYGSRAKGNYKPSSDIDLTFKGENLDLNVLNKISMEIDDLLLPYTFDLSLFKHIKNDDLLSHVNRVGKIIYSKRV